MMKWGILGSGRIAHRFARSLEHIEGCELYAISCRTQQKADAFFKEHHASKAYAGFDCIVNDEEIDAVYIATPHQFHIEWILKCLKAHKAVLCEKPACMNADEMQQVMQCAKENNTLFMEAMKTRFEPVYQEVKKQIQSGVIGPIQSMHVCLCNAVDLDTLKGSYLLDPSSGGVLTDTGIYCISWIEDYLKQDYTLNHVYANIKNDVNLYTRAEMSFSDVQVTLECAMDRDNGRQVTINGTKGSVTIDTMHRPQLAYLYTDHKEVIEIPYMYDDFYGQLQEFVTLYQNHAIESQVMPLTSSLRCCEIMDCIAHGLQYNPTTLHLLDTEESDFDFAQLDEQAMQYLGALLQMNQRYFPRSAAIQIKDMQENVVFSYIPEGKDKNLVYLQGKENVVKHTNHSSFYVYVKHQLDGSYDDLCHDFSTYCVSGGGYPLKENGKLKFIVLVSGMHEGEDHELIRQCLYQMKGSEEPDFPYILF